jgi:hypothetical protein
LKPIHCKGKSENRPRLSNRQKAMKLHTYIAWS